MAQRETPGIGLQSDYELGEDGWKVGMDGNLLKISVLINTSIQGFLDAVPGAATDGQVWAITAGANTGTLALRDKGAWVFYPVKPGYLVFNRTDGVVYVRSVAGLWERIDKDQASVVADLTALREAIYKNMIPGPAVEGSMAGITGWHAGWKDPAGNVVAGLDSDFYWNALSKNMPGVPFLSPYLYAVTLPDGRLVFGVTHEGVLVTAGGQGAAVAELLNYTSEGVSQVILKDVGGLRQITFDKIGATGIRVETGFAIVGLSNGEGGFIETPIETIAANTFSDTITEIRLVVGYGQSLSVGSSSTPIQTTAPLDAGRAQMFGRTRLNQYGNPVPHTALYSLVNLYETPTGSETPVSRNAHRQLQGMAANQGVIAFSAGIGGQPYVALKKGTNAWEGLFRAIYRGKVIASLKGKKFKRFSVNWTQGEADRTLSFDTYYAYMVELFADLNIDFGHLFAEEGNVPLILDQVSNWTAYGHTTNQVPLAQLAAALDNPGEIFCVGPKYILPTVSDGVHLTGPGSAWHGEYQGRVNDIVLAGGDWKPTHAESMVIVGNTAVLNYHTPMGHALAIDDSRVSNPGNFGIVVVGSGPAITSVVQTADQQITVNLSAAPTAALTLGIADRGIPNNNAGPTTGPRSCIRDTSTDYSIDGLTPLHNYACHQTMTAAP